LLRFHRSLGGAEWRTFGAPSGPPYCPARLS
jgi:hypothetical protein